ncbi:MAG TPA: HAD-IA family hydrolase [Nocardioides sp.]|uniref:HAD-IA family hydrolase n=1 Tax=Nocardioides sp. TaxID=35761 RepID=UPI002E322BC6|nr:HAD-IA family hydrolase [Nocardioides sp.]HEX5087206.1 HAD-IA family hydrolase [Nocardioides sp.]
MIRAVVLDIGSVLEVIDDSLFPGPFEDRHDLPPGSVHAGAATLPGDAGRGELTEAQVRAHWQQHLGLTDAQADELMADYWRWYVGTLDQELFDWFAAQRPRFRTGIVSNSGPGAREAERCWGFEDITDDIVYSHEVGLLKPDPRIFVLAAERLGVGPEEVVFLDDVEGHVAAAREVGFRGVVHRSTPRSIVEVRAVIEAEQR